MNLLNEANDSKFVTRKWNIVSDNANANYDVGNEIIYNTEVLKSNLCDYYDAYILVRGCITVTAALATKVAFKSMCGFYCIGLIEYMLVGKSFLDYTNFFLQMTIKRMTK